jgi:hypothetical protein
MVRFELLAEVQPNEFPISSKDFSSLALYGTGRGTGYGEQETDHG